MAVAGPLLCDLCNRRTAAADARSGGHGGRSLGDRLAPDTGGGTNAIAADRIRGRRRLQHVEPAPAGAVAAAGSGDGGTGARAPLPVAAAGVPAVGKPS